MSHNVRIVDYPENCNRKQIEKNWDRFVEREDYEEGSSGLPGCIRWLDSVPPCANREEAEEYIKVHDSGWYDQLAVRYYEVEDLKQSKTYDTLAERAERLNKRYHELKNNIHYKGVKSQFVSCRCCGSKIASRYIGKTVNNTCPICHHDLRPESTLKQIARAADNSAKAKKDLEQEKRKLEQKQRKNAKVFWLLKIEYHT